MKAIRLHAQPRILRGRKVSQLRARAFVPGVIYGKGIASQAIEMALPEFSQVYAATGETGLVELNLGSDVRPALIKSVQVHPVTNKFLHVDFYQVDLKTKVTAHVPLKITGAAPAVTDRLGVLLQLINEAEVEALPTDLPEYLEVDISKLAQIGDTILIGQLTVSPAVTVLTSGSLEVVKIGELISRETEAEVKAEEEKAQQLQAEAAAVTPTTPAGPAEAVTSTPQVPAKAEKQSS
ncbi:TPA: 50S ribosomal protein L25 [Patescibacteria group bacterium]|uniref:Large ribosomal subunit protein bL25 n=1 Tax=Candidatus Gottesmanbacteria bacterium GW2011_GWA1_43_11 TaxID=1618436 RepID=A0A0G1CIE6_9BACT|nr:MAG: 50S ribosomal protein L25 [Candidatus Gottesmanbacteria bacterium GW2011_GWA1_43_11]HCS79237.1 50S ribosomal protein L25 [Patescibacteria group bacterium]